MNETKKTIWFAAVAVVLALAAFIFAPGRITPDAFLDQGEPFYPEFTDPNEATTLEVIDYDEASGQARPFKVTFSEDHWTIPSHHNYPADAKDRLAKTAAGIIDIKKDDFRTSSVADHEQCGVIDPLDENAVQLTGRGSRITVRGADGGVLADFIIGKEVPGREGFRFVRVPGQNRVYAARMNLDLSTRFSDWIQTDLLEVTADKIDQITLNDYSINERTLSVETRGHVTLMRDGETWKIRGAKGDRPDSAKVKKILKALEGLSIVGVRPKPAGISAGLTSSTDAQSMPRSERLSLQSKGFYFDNDGRLLSNEGELKVSTTDGVIYTLRFGEVLYGSGLAVSAGVSETDEGKTKGAEVNRYLFITTEFDEGHFKRPPKPGKTDFLDKPDSLWTDADKENKKSYDEYQRWERQVDNGRETSARLNDRFAGWYYVISNDDFDKIHFSKKDLLDN